MQFDYYIGIDYSGRGEPTKRTSGIQVVEMDRDGQVSRISPNGLHGRTFSWSRKEVYDYLRNRLTEQKHRFVIGIDHSLSFPVTYFKQHDLSNWDEFLNHFQALWNTKVESVRDCKERVDDYPNHNELRITETFTASAKSAWNFEQKTGTVAYSTHAGLPWIYELRQSFRENLHNWPYDGWKPCSEKSVLAEVYPSLLYKRFRQNDPGFPLEWPRDAQDAYAIAAWLRERDLNGTLERYFEVSTLTEQEKQLALQFEGWILGVC
ncbi:hypothetical protein R4Z10_12855 [Niallia sp. XMNu-256]|uniref:hypothetical protein n=1 Tax=Niallia sp. XMNu-256 TaxID=3082444 RepID=UPI0030CD6C68